MGIPERREREKEQRKAVILDCAMHIFVKKGIADATMDEIAECAEFSKATLYLYFKNKEELVFHAIGCVLDNFSSYLVSELSTVNAPEEKMSKIGEAYLKFYRECYGQFLMLNSQDSSTHGNFSDTEFYQEVRNKSDKLWQIICEPIAACVKSGYLRPEIDVMEIAVTLWGASNGILNLMNHVDFSHKTPEFKDYEFKDKYLKHFNGLDFEKMLRTLWDSIINNYKQENRK